MPSTTPPADAPADQLVKPDEAAEQAKTEKAEALDEVIREASEAKRTEWRPRHKATVARRLGTFEEGLKRNSVKPPPR